MNGRIAVCIFMGCLFAAHPLPGQTVKGQSIKVHAIRLSTNDKTAKGTGPKIAFLSDKPLESSDSATRACYAFLDRQAGFNCAFIPARDLGKHPSEVNKYDIIFYQKNEMGDIPPGLLEPKMLKIIKEFLNKGGKMLLSGFALHYLNDLGLETEKPHDSLKPCNDEGYGRKLGFHAFLDHPVFDGMNGGAYVLRPLKDQLVGLCGYFGDNPGLKGKVVAVDWDYIFLREESKLILEYMPGHGKVLAVGGYLDFSQPNLNRLHLERFTLNCLAYLSGNMKGKPDYWDYSPNTVSMCRPDTAAILRKSINQAICWKEPADPLVLERRFSSDEFWDVAGERMLTMGTENGGIEEVWAHPFMAFRDYEVGIKFDYRDTIYWLNDQRPEIRVHPAYFSRIYKFPRAYIKEIVVNDPSDPAGIIHYEYKGVYGAEMFIHFKSAFRWMWPYPEKATGSLCYAWVNEMQAIRLTDNRGNLALFIGADKPAGEHVAGQFSDFSIDKNYKAKGIPTAQFQVAGFLHYRLRMTDQIDVVYASGNEGAKTISEVYEKYLQSPVEVFQHALSHTDELFRSRLMVTSPDPDFNAGYRWAVASADKFFVRTPGMGASLVAGYASTKHGWDGGQKVSGRPGYAWYFGRDGQWSGFALLGEGDYSKVRSELELYRKYQDLNGKILHEASTSGIIHYDAADATPLYIILAGRYFRFTNDTAFLRQNWPYIKKAISFCFSTDTDNDHLIENTNVGHGWVEGGELYGSHATLYMAACWSEALKEAFNMASHMKDAESGRYLKENGIVNHIINTGFWNSTTRFFSYGKNRDGTFRPEPTVLPAVALSFGLADPDKASPVLRQYASNAFTTNWGTRILRDDSRLFRPTGYHYGSVWPLFTGWAAMAEYRYGNLTQGFSLLMNNLNVYHAWALGSVQEVMNGAVYKPSGVCANQCWSETMVVQPVLEGLLGLDADAGKNTLSLAPALPANWDSLDVRNIRSGEKHVNMHFQRRENFLTYIFGKNTEDTLAMRFSPLLPAGSQVLSCMLDKKEVPFSLDINRSGTRVKTEFILVTNDTLEIEYSNGISVLPVIQEPRPGCTSAGLRIIETELNGKIYTVLAENKTGADSELKLWINGQKISHIENGRILRWDSRIVTVQMVFPLTGAKYTEVPLKIYLE